MGDATEDLKSAIVTARSSGEVILQVRERIGCGGPLLDELDHFALVLGLRALGTSWAEIDRLRALELLREALQKDLAYSAEVMPPAEAESLAIRFLEMFAGDAHFFSNIDTCPHIGDHAERKVLSTSSWTPLTDFTFDTGVVGIDADRVGIRWVMDED